MVALAAMGLGALLCLAPGAVADDGLRVGSDSRFSVDEPARLVAGHMELKVANVKPDPPGGYYFYNTLTFVVPAAIGEVRATANGSGVRVTRGLARTRGPRHSPSPSPTTCASARASRS